MFGLDDAIIYGKAGISIVPSIIEITKKVKKRAPEPSIQEVIDQLISDTRENCKSLRDETNAIERSLRDLRVEPSKSLREISKDLRWYNWGAKNKLSKHKKKLQQIEESLSQSVDDFIAVLVCSGKIPSLTAASARSESIKRKLNSLTQKPIQDLLKDYRSIIDGYLDELR
jgi:hypothetical protein